jgi:methylmalonyl-CoA mutase N-terminal domain/subunit
VNEYSESSTKKFEVLKIKPAVEKEQIQRLRAFKKRRNQKLVASHLQKITNAAKSTSNLMPLFIDAVEAHVTLGEISDALRDVFGRHKETISI